MSSGAGIPSPEAADAPRATSEGLTSTCHAGALLAAVVLLFSRRPDAFLMPQFWAEDGAVWFSDAVRAKCWALFVVPQAGALHLFERLVAALSMGFSPRSAPAVFNIAALLVQVAPVPVLLSRRSAKLASLRVRVLLACACVCLPNSFEIHMNVTNAQWHLALLLFLVLALSPSGHIGWKVFDWVVLILAGLTGPFAIFVAPLCWLRWARKELGIARVSWVTLCAAVQGTVLAGTSGLAAREHAALGASASALSRIVGGQIGVGALFGRKVLRVLSLDAVAGSVVCALFAVVVLAACGLAARRGPDVLRHFLAFAGAVFAAALVSSSGNGGMPAWDSLGRAGGGGRYWFLPMLAFLASLLVLSRPDEPAALRVPALALLLCFPLGAVIDWRYRPFADFHWGEHVTAWQSAVPARPMEIPINPPGWKVVLPQRP